MAPTEKSFKDFFPTWSKSGPSKTQTSIVDYALKMYWPFPYWTLRKNLLVAFILVFGSFCSWIYVCLLFIIGSSKSLFFRGKWRGSRGHHDPDEMLTHFEFFFQLVISESRKKGDGRKFRQRHVFWFKNISANSLLGRKARSPAPFCLHFWKDWLSQ